MRSEIYAAVAVGLAASLGGCATVTRGTTTQFAVTSTPPGAAVKTSTGFSCDATPCSMKMPRKHEFDVTVTKVGYQSKTQHVRSAVAGAGAAGMAGNIVLGGVIGMAVDGTSGAMDDLTPNPIHFDLEPDSAAADPPPDPTPSPATATSGAAQTHAQANP